MKEKKRQKSLLVMFSITIFNVPTIRKWGVVSIFIVLSITVKSQMLSPFVIASSGNSNVGADCILNWTLGEIEINTLSQTSVILTQGFQQNFLEMQVNVKEIEKTTVDGFSIFPVPAKDILNVGINQLGKDSYMLEVINAQGLKVLIAVIPAYAITEKVDISSLSPGVYALRIAKQQTKTLKTIKFVKQ